MTAFKGTNGNDFLTGTNGDDRFTPLLGQDVVLGGAGLDVLAIDYSTISGAASYDYASSIFMNGPALGGIIWASDGSNNVSFSDVEQISGTLDNGNNLLYLYGSGASPDAFNLNGGGGDDRLSIGVEFFGDFDFIVGPNGKAHGSLGQFSNFESYEISLGLGSHRVTTGNGGDRVFDYGGSAVINTGGGDDQIVSYHSVDHVSGGAGYDWWGGTYDTESLGLSFAYDGNSGSLSNGTSISGIEKVSLTTGTGNDHITVSGTSEMYIDAGSGADTLTADFSGSSNPPSELVVSSDAEGSIAVGYGGQIGLTGFETVSIVTGADATSAEVSLQALTGPLVIDGGAGNDDMVFSWQTFDPINVTVAADGTLTGDVGVTLKNFESLTIFLGGGSDTMSGGAGDEVIFARGGSDRVDGGAGADTVSGGSGADTFIFDQLSDFAASGHDRIIDFNSAQGDKIDLRGLSQQGFTFVADAAFTGHGSGPEIRFDHSGGDYVVQGDLDGDGVSDFQFTVTTSSLGSSDFFFG